MSEPLDWLVLMENPIDVVGLVLFLLVFPVYHGILYPLLVSLLPQHAAKVRIDAFRRSWIESLLERRDLIFAVQQTRNLTMVNSLLASSSLILMGVTANILIRHPRWSEVVGEPDPWSRHSDALAVKLFLLILVFAVAFSYCMTSLRHLGHFNLVIGASPEVIEEHEGSAVEYFTTLVNRASNRHTLAVRCLYSASPVLLWLFDSRFFVGMTLFWGIKFIGFQDFSHVLWSGRSRSMAGAQNSPAQDSPAQDPAESTGDGDEPSAAGRPDTR